MVGRGVAAILVLLWCAVPFCSALDYEFPDPEIIVLPAEGAEAEAPVEPPPPVDPQPPAEPQAPAKKKVKKKKVIRKPAGQAKAAHAYTPTYDTLPRFLADMSEYDQIAMEPYADRYDDAPLHEKAAMYASQFEFMNGRPPEYHPVDVAEIELSKQTAETDTKRKRGRKKKKAEAPAAENQAQAQIADPAPEPEEASSSPASFDPLPRRYEDMDEYERIAMSPYETRYDGLPVHEQADLYARQFTILRDRPPAYSPADLEEIENSRENAGPVAEKREAIEPPPPSTAALRSAPTTRYTLRPPSFFDSFPRQFKDMDEYSRIALEPFKDTYDTMPIHERADLYATQFEQVHGRLPVLSPPDLDEIENSRELAAAGPSADADDPDAAPAGKDGGTKVPQAGKKRVVSVKSKPPGRGVYDALPRQLSELPEYFREAMEPYEDIYDDLPLNEKAELYAREFEELRGREPVFSPLTLEEIETAIKKQRPPEKYVRYEERRRRLMYNEAPRRRSKIDGVDMTAIPGPWEKNRKPEPEEEEEEDDFFDENRPRPGTRMDSLRRGWLRDREE